MPVETTAITMLLEEKTLLLKDLLLPSRQEQGHLRWLPEIQMQHQEMLSHLPDLMTKILVHQELQAAMIML